MPTYEVYTDAFGDVWIIRFNENGSISYIPEDPANADYQEYLKSLNEPA